MANQQQLEILKQGVGVWNEWRKNNLKIIRPDLSDANLIATNLMDVDVYRADLLRAELNDADLKDANLFDADFRGANLSNADLRGANFFDASLSDANLGGADITGAILYSTSRDDWKIDCIKCDYIYFDPEGKERTPKDRNFEPGEFEQLYKWRPLDDFERLIERSIEFPPEYKQAGVSILNYFSEILRKKYPESDATVQIKQDGLKISMVIDPAKGEREIIEKTLNDYGLVITGQMRPEEFTDDKHLIIELKSELRIAHARIEMQKDLLLDKSAQIDKLFLMLGNAVQTPHHVHVNNQASGGNTINAHDVAKSRLVAGSGNKT